MDQSIRHNQLRAVLAAAMFLGAAACGSDDGTGHPGGAGGTGGTGGVDGTGGVGGIGGVGGVGENGGSGGAEPVITRWVTDSIRFPDDESVGVDLDRDGTIDNSLAKSLALLSALGPGISFDEYLASGKLIQLHELAAISLEEAASASWTVFTGEPVDDPDFGGDGTFTVSSTVTTFEGAIVAGRFEGGADSLLLTIPIFGGAAPLPLSRARVEADVTAAGCDGFAGGSISADLLAAGIALAVNAAIEAEGCSPDVPCSTMLQGALALFDANGDYRISSEEISRNPMWSLAIHVDIDTDGDGTPDAISVGCGFTCVGARFEPTAGS